MAERDSSDEIIVETGQACKAGHYARGRRGELRPQVAEWSPRCQNALRPG